MALVKNYQEDSDEAPEEFSFKAGKEAYKKERQIQCEEIHKTKQIIKKRKRHQENKEKQKIEIYQKKEQVGIYFNFFLLVFNCL